MTSSGLGAYPIPGVLAYSMSKTFSSFFAQGLSIEEKGSLDCLSFEVGVVKTKLIGDDGPGGISTEQAVNACLRELGSTSKTHGHISHDLMQNLTPKSVLQAIMLKVSEKIYEKRVLKEGKMVNAVK